MATAIEYTKEQLNYYRICYVTTDILAEGLRSIFKQEWDNRYKTTLGEWKDEPKNGLDSWKDCIHGLSAKVQSNVDDLRKFRNEEFAHMTQGHLTDAEFQNAISIVHVAFQALGLPTVQIQAIKNQSSFPTEELRDVLKEVDDFKQELQLKGLKKANEHSLSYLYISGNPGSGKSQLAGLAAKRFFNEVKGIPDATSFVMTVNAESSETLLESYVSFARHLKCPEYAVTNTLHSKYLNTEEKITDLKTLISTKIELYTSWLLVVDNVTNISRVHGHLPELATMLSGVADSEMEQEVAQALDYQPLALASAATYIRQVRHNKVSSNFGWNDYLKKLEKGQRGYTETILAETNPSYPKSMTAAITLAVENSMSSDEVINHTFSFISVCAPQQPLRLDIVTDYILDVHKEIKDEEAIRMRISRCSLLLFGEEKSGEHIRVHQVVHDAINTVITNLPEIQHLQVVNGAVRSFSQFIAEHLSVDDLDSLRNDACNVRDVEDAYLSMGNVHFDLSDFHQAKEHYVDVLAILRKELGPEHDSVGTVYNNLGAVYTKLGDLGQAKDYYDHALVILQKKRGPDHVDLANIYNNLGTVHRDLGDLAQAKDYHDRALAIRLKKQGPEHVDVASTYNGLGTTYKGLGDLGQAKDYHDRALAIRLKKLGPEHVDVASTYINLGNVHSNLSELEAGERVL
ncbi:hypothetical protein OS493_026251 [Desmophyllum pertusum]|uniref:Kinesin light chain n=1 Tax=Desmophyllum pertusum TaxID=174260 RepID=A0A9W9ZLH8_9CNID|nr:hypothetical protein OS493_026251 [Desmophyllum pertusum]